MTNDLNIDRADLSKIESLDAEQLKRVRRNIKSSEYTDEETREALTQACADAAQKMGRY